MEGLGDTREPTKQAVHPSQRSSSEDRQADEKPRFFQPGRLHRVGSNDEPVNKAQKDCQSDRKAQAQGPQCLKRSRPTLRRQPIVLVREIDQLSRENASQERRRCDEQKAPRSRARA